MSPTEIRIEYVFFAACAALAVLGALGTVLLPNPIRGALSLLFSIVAIAGFYLQLHAPFLAAIQLIVYAGAVVVLFLFVIMLIGPDATPLKDSRGLLPRVVGGVIGSAVTLHIVLILAKKMIRIPPAQAGFGSVEAFGEVLFGEYLIPFEVASALLLVAVVGAVAVARGNQPDPKLAKGSAAAHEQPARDGAEGVSAQLAIAAAKQGHAP
ncbi:MAG: NADH-quinone oxidoreductase subunit J [Polyangiales bacterium]